MRVYLAAGWFSDEQERARLEIREVLLAFNIDHYSPKDDFLYKPGMDAEIVFRSNVDEIRKSDLIVASTEGKDMGTMWECGYAFGINVPVLYYYKYTGKFNLMLSQSAVAVVNDQFELSKYLAKWLATGTAHKIPYIGEQE